jgi:uncharacterized protein YndB with AHSA1/START domain
MVQDIKTAIEIAAPADRVWSVLTHAGDVEKWLGCLRYQPVLGHVFYMQQDNARRARGDIEGAIHCQVEALDRRRRFAFSWYFPDMPKTHVEIRLAPSDVGTRASLVHAGWNEYPPAQAQPIRDGLATGWSQFVLPMLKKVAEG